MNTKDIAQVKLPNAGDKVTVLVEQCRKLPFGRFPELEICGTIASGERRVVLMPYPTGTKQLKRLNWDTQNEHGVFEAVTGQFVTIKRDENKSQPERPYWSIYLALEDEVAQFGPYQANPAPAQRVPSPQSSQPEPKKRPAAGDPVQPEERDEAEKKRRARMSELTRIYRAMWVDELDFQTSTMLEREQKELPVVAVDGASVNAAVASRWIEFNKKNLL